ncbi:MAG: hypothetical protein D6826_05025 [Alphaproteobacteria bacterium]|nr:MAG: hypothetical protein D6826_05025 [Alphaproteobacteria bacterium]
MDNSKTVRDFAVTAGPIPGSRKIHVPGERFPGIRVPMREIPLHPTANEPPVLRCDTSGAYTDPEVRIDLRSSSVCVAEPPSTPSAR